MYNCITYVFSLTTLAFIGLSLSQDIGIGPCPTPKIQKDFDIKRFSGKWYQIERYQGNYFTTRTIRCNIVSYEAVNNRTVAINNTYISTAQVGNISVQSTYRSIWLGKVVDENEPAKMVVETQIGPDESYYGDGSNLQMNYWILDTGYETSALVWTCTSNGEFFTQYAELLHRTDFLSQDILDAIHRRLYLYNFNPDYFRSVKHNQSADCDY